MSSFLTIMLIVLVLDGLLMWGLVHGGKVRAQRMEGGDV